MPRPKRTKVAPSAPAPRVRKAPPKTTPAVNTAVDAPKAQFDDLYDVSDPEDRGVGTVRHVKKNNGKGKGKAAMESAGRAAKGDVRASIQRRNSQAGSDNRENSIASPIEDNIFDDIEHGSNSPEIEVGRRERNTPAVENSSLAIGNFRRRARQPSILGRGAGRARSSSVESNLAEDTGLTGVGRTNSSVLATGNFKRRPRQNSILGRNTTAIAPSSMGLEISTPAQVGSALKLGNFKRRARAPSILGTAQKARQQPDYDDEDEDDFNPEDESTPLNKPKTRNMTSSSSASTSNSRKRKLSSVQAPQSSPTRRSPEAEEDEERIPATVSVIDDGEEHEEDQAPSSPQEPHVSYVESRSVSQEPMSETMAPPQGSSSVASSPEPPLPAKRPVSRGRRKLRGSTPPPATLDSPISSPPSLTHSPNRLYMTAKPKGKKEAPPTSKFSTAQLQALLPRRRRQTTRDPFDIPTSEDEAEETNLASDEDELSHINVRARNRRSVFARTPAPSKKPTKAKQPPKSNAKRTYASRTTVTSDKENEVDPDDSLAPLPDDDGNASPENSQEMEERLGKELKEAARKFQEVDKWELEFEDVTGSSSPKDAR
ncbi:hypothetical protein LOCC1_G004220 [Lachnellula occidentalis]|uniref:Uncharacterized protein n=1 Tax=Lachnellula occidentalis TaxID=215460 RepID=A0A8H8RVF8_9HELO|nr:hypothetical protein LOCC1_G004220 [Lachnellula occidentalis]